MNPTIILIGAGQLGSRHLQGLAKIKTVMDIHVVDPNEDSLTIAKQRFEEIKGFTGTIRYSTAVPQKQQFDIAIIATNANIRRKVVEQLLSDNEIRNMILEKFLFQRKEDYIAIEKLITTTHTKTWVNCPRRMFPYYKEVKSSLTNQSHTHFSVSCSNIHLGSNVIHYIDLFAFLSGDASFTVDTQLDIELLQSKRNGYIEFSGHVYGKSAHMSFDIHSYPTDGTIDLLTIQSPDLRYIIQESSPAHILASSKENNWEWQKKEIRMPYQSELTNLVCEEILSTGSCSLTPYHESMKFHVEILEQFIRHYNTINHTTTDLCQIT